jgi:NADH-ubiquinone oxidoreductase chain 1
MLANSFSFVELEKVKSIAALIFFPIVIPWIISILAETNRAPFDLPEGEAELVSGFNVEYGAGLFALIFIAEYSNVLIFRVISRILFFSRINLLVFSLIIASLTLWIRATLPIIRYDQLIYIAWKCFIPLSISFLVYSIFFL